MSVDEGSKFPLPMHRSNETLELVHSAQHQCTSDMLTSADTLAKITSESWTKTSWKTFFYSGVIQLLISSLQNKTTNAPVSVQGQDWDQVQWEMPFSSTGNKDLFYAFSPIPMIPRTIQKIRADRTTVMISSRGVAVLSFLVITIAPTWLRQTWYSDLLQMSTYKSITLPLWYDLLSQNNGWIFHPELQKLHLTAWLLTVSAQKS